MEKKKRKKKKKEAVLLKIMVVGIYLRHKVRGQHRGDNQNQY